MARDWTRRSVLAAASTLTLAGCIGASDDPAPSHTTTPTSSRKGGESGETPTSPAGQRPSRTETAVSPPDPGTTTGSRSRPDPPASIETDWPVPAHDPGLSNYAAGTPGVTGPVGELWHVETSTKLSGPVLADGMLFVGGRDGVVRARDARTGEARWRRTIGQEAGTPRAIGDRLVVPTPEAIVGLDRVDGTERWHVDTPARRGFLGSPGGVYYIQTAPSPAVVCLVPADGSERWREEIADPWSSTLIAGDQVVVVSTDTETPTPWMFSTATGEFVGPRRPSGSGHHFPGERFYLDGIVYATDPFYGQFWTFDASSDTYTRQWNGGFDDNPGGYHVAAGDGVLFAHERGSRTLHALSVEGDDGGWSRSGVDRLTARPVVTDETVVVRTESSLRCVDPGDGTDLWKRQNQDVGNQFVVVDDLLFTTRNSILRAFRSR